MFCIYSSAGATQTESMVFSLSSIISNIKGKMSDKTVFIDYQDADRELKNFFCLEKNPSRFVEYWKFIKKDDLTVECSLTNMTCFCRNLFLQYKS